MYNVFVNDPEKWVVKMQGSKSHVISEISQDWRISGGEDQASRMGRMIAVLAASETQLMLWKG